MCMDCSVSCIRDFWTNELCTWTSSPVQLCKKTQNFWSLDVIAVSPRGEIACIWSFPNSDQSAELPSSLPRCSYPGRKNEGGGRGWNENCSHSYRFPQRAFCLPSSELEWFTFHEEQARKLRSYANSLTTTDQPNKSMTLTGVESRVTSVAIKKALVST